MNKSKIANWDKVCISEEREFLLKALSAGLDAISVEKNLEAKIKFTSSAIKIGKHKFNLDGYREIYLLAIGSYSGNLGELIKNHLGKNLKATNIFGLDKHQNKAKALKNLSENLSEEDLIICAIAGTISDLLDWETESESAQIFYKTSQVRELGEQNRNILNKHIFSLAGGGLAKTLYPAHVIGLNLDLGEETLSSLKLLEKDPATMYQAKEVITQNNLGIGKIFETPKEEKYFKKITSAELASNQIFFKALENNLIEKDKQVKLLLSKNIDLNSIENKDVIISSQFGWGGILDLVINLKKNDTLLLLEPDGKGKIYDYKNKDNFIKSEQNYKDNEDFQATPLPLLLPKVAILYRAKMD